VNLLVDLPGVVCLVPATELLQEVHVNVSPDGAESHATNAQTVTGERNVKVRHSTIHLGEVLISACTGECTQCDDGFTGTGTCLGTTTDSVKGESSELLS
jgi:hypothetical protein